MKGGISPAFHIYIIIYISTTYISRIFRSHANVLAVCLHIYSSFTTKLQVPFNLPEHPAYYESGSSLAEISKNVMANRRTKGGEAD